MTIYVTPAYIETFAHPLVEAMASGLPVVASDLAVHREICGEAAVYFPRFSAEGLAETVARIARSRENLRGMVSVGRERSLQFSWKRHVEEILELSCILASGGPPRAANSLDARAIQ
jgi:glycosyltransferase involved in cell wall biosynthesis